MTSASRSLLSGSLGIVLIALSTISAAFAGLEATTTLAAIGALVIWGLYAIGSVENEPRARRAAVKVSAAVPAVVAFPSAATVRRAA